MDKELQIILKKLAEIIYEQFIKDLVAGNLNIFKNRLEPLPVVGKIKNVKKKN